MNKEIEREGERERKRERERERDENKLTVNSYFFSNFNPLFVNEDSVGIIVFCLVIKSSSFFHSSNQKFIAIIHFDSEK